MIIIFILVIRIYLCYLLLPELTFLHIYYAVFVDINKLFILNNCILWFTWCSRILWVLTNVKWHVSRMKASYRACHCPKGPLCSAYSVLPPPLSPSPLETTDLFADSIVLPFLECRIVGIVQENIRHVTC